MNKDQERCYQIYDWYCVDENIDNDDSSESDQLNFLRKSQKYT